MHAAEQARLPSSVLARFMRRARAEIVRARSRKGMHVLRRACALKCARRKRVTGCNLARLVAALEPAHALLRTAVREALGPHASPRLALQRIVADHAGGLERLLHVAGL